MKRYLTGIDWIMHALDHAGKKQAGIGNISQVVLQLSGQPKTKQLAESLYTFLRQFPFINGTPSRGLNLCPYWKTYPRKKTLLPRINCRLDTKEDTLTLLAKAGNEPFQDIHEHLSFNLVSAPEQTYFSMVFDHRLLDARGAEAFLGLFDRYYRQETLPQVSTEEDPHLDRWQEKFIAGRQVNRAFIGLAREKPRALPVPPGKNTCRFITAGLDADASERFIEKAYTQAGYLMLMPYALAKSTQILHAVFEKKRAVGANYLIPVSIDPRPQKTVNSGLFFNHASFFLFKIPVATVGDLAALVARIKEQMYEQVQTGLPEAIQKASMLLRIAPLPLVNLFLKSISRKDIASFSFSFVNSAYPSERFLGQEVRNIFHLPRVPNPPGLGVFFNQYANRINAALSYTDGVLDESEAESITNRLKILGDEE